MSAPGTAVRRWAAEKTVNIAQETATARIPPDREQHVLIDRVDLAVAVQIGVCGIGAERRQQRSQVTSIDDAVAHYIPEELRWR